jgi:hypothetical protein
MQPGMRTRVDDLVLVQGIRDTRTTLAAWNRAPWAVLRGWLAASSAVAVGLLLAVWAIAAVITPDPTPVLMPGLNAPGGLGAVAHVLLRNSLVLALHGFACVAGFIALNSLPYSATQRSGISRIVHERTGPYAMLFVAGATLFSLGTQAHFIGGILATASAQLGLSNLHLLLLLAPHAMLELTALFLPLAAWLVASRRGDWDQLLAATFVTVAAAVPALLLAVSMEVYLFPELIRMSR